ncbi:MAG: thymidine phosphorylase, partial [Actinomycetota bacterium]|nr:thymidine phosphorylase [Actinomycetota bacterium]
MTGFEEEVAAVLRGLRPGEVVTYGEVAAEAGHPGAARAVGRVLATSDGDLPWWRVVTSTGRLVPGHEAEHARRLRAEGVSVEGERPQNEGTVNFVALIEKKRDGGAFAPDEIRWLIEEYTEGRAPDYQMAALLMAIFLKGIDGEELGAWTHAMLTSGKILDFSHLAAPKIDKHSTGGVGDGVSISLAPIVAACGVAVPMISGRGLGHTGGTLDKLETIPGFRTRLEPGEFRSLVERHGLVLAGQSDSIAPADGMIYALRDATGTVPSIPLIASSIMSKKLAEGIEGLVLDVKVGRGAFMKYIEEARELAEIMIGIGRSNGTRVTAFLTDMSQPLGREVGNASEIRESVDVLKGGGPRDLVELVLALGSEMLVLGGVEPNEATARDRMQKAIDSGAAFEKLVEVAEAQGGDPRVLEDPSLLATAKGDYVIE